MNLIRATCEGPVVGKEEGKHILWAGIPFAAPVDHQTRFKLAKDALPRTEVLDCTCFRASSIQGRQGHVLPQAGESNDCLFLNIWAPSAPVQPKLPVLFWIHGGGFLGGTGAGYWGGKFCEDQGVIVVTINYRLSVVGFTNWNSILKDPHHRFDDHVGLNDQARALKWVHKNIVGFGGDPDRITIAGESAGAVSVLMLLTDKELQRCYHQAVIQSGSPNLIDDLEESRSKAIHVAKCVLRIVLPTLSDTEKHIVVEALKTSDFSHPSICDILVRTSTEDMHKGIWQYAAESSGGLPYGPWLDGIEFPGNRFDMLDRISPSVRVLMGHNKHECMLWKMTHVEGQPEELPISRSTIEAKLIALPPKAVSEIESCYPLSSAEGWVQLSSDMLFVNGTRRVAKELVERGITVYRYRVDKFFEEGPWADYAPHAMELLAFWDLPFSRSFKDSHEYTGANTQALMQVMRNCWGAFIHDGNPGWSRLTGDKKQIGVFDTTSPSKMDVRDIADLPEESPKLVAAWEPYELHI